MEKILMIHGMGTSSWCFENYKHFFKKRGFVCIVPSLRYHDVDPKLPPPKELGTTSILDYVDDLEKEIKKLCKPPIIIGHSMGGLLAQILASKDLAKAAILLAPAPPKGISVLSIPVIKSSLSKLRWGFWRKPLRSTFKEAKESTLRMLCEDEQRRIYEKFVHESGRATFEIAFPFLDRKRATYVDENRVECPILCICGSEDNITPPSLVKKISEKYRKNPKCKVFYKEFEGHGHWLLGEPGWEKIAEFIYRWIIWVTRSEDDQKARFQFGFNDYS